MFRNTPRSATRTSNRFRQTTLDVFLKLKDSASSSLKRPLVLKRNKRKCEDKTLSLYACLDLQNQKRRKVVSDEIHSQQEASEIAPAVISYRDGRGALFDHRALQVISQQPTVIVMGETATLTNLWMAIKGVTFDLSYGTFDSCYARHIPPVVEVNNQQGLLVIPGVSSLDYVSPGYQARKAFEFKLIEKARNCGQPVMGICGGSWLIWESYGGKITNVTDHSFRSGMPRLVSNGKVGYNKQIHRISLQQDASLLKAALDFDENKPVLFPVNSVHSYAVDASTRPIDLQVSAVAKQDDSLAPISAHNKSEEKMQPTENSVEAFESLHGAPILGVQWHPEAYTTDELPYSKNQQKLINYMIQAGQTYKNRQLVNEELLKNYNIIKNNLRKTDLVDNYNGVLTRKTDSHIHFSLFKLQNTGTPRHRDEAMREIQIKEDYLREKGWRLV